MGEAEAGERRGRERHAIEGLGIVLCQSRAARGPARAINVSLGGILLESDSPWPPAGSDVELTFSIESVGLIFTVPGKVVRLVGDNQAGIQFLQESDQLRRVIERALGGW